MGYLNNVLAAGVGALVSAAAERGTDGLIVVDAPDEETTELSDACARHGLHRILMVAPTSTPERVVRLARRSGGFVYCVSVTGVTGERTSLPEDVEQMVRRIQRVTSTPVGVGFGIGSPEQAAAIGRFADGVVVGSALVRRIEEAASPAAAIESAVGFDASLAEAVRTARA